MTNKAQIYQNSHYGIKWPAKQHSVYPGVNTIAATCSVFTYFSIQCFEVYYYIKVLLYNEEPTYFRVCIAEVKTKLQSDKVLPFSN